MKEAGLVILPSTHNPSATSRDFREKDEVLRVPLGLDHVGALDAPATFDLFGKSITIDTRVLMNVSTASGGDIGSYPSSTIVMCRPPDNHLAKQLAAAATLLLSTLVDRFSPWTQVCLADTDADGAADHAFMVGTRLAEDRRLFPITPVRYTLQRNVPLDNAYMSIRYLDPAAFAGPRLQITVVNDDKPLELSGIRVGREAKWIDAIRKIKDKRLPQTIDVAGAQIVVDRFSPDKKVLTAHVAANATPALFEYALLPTTIYVYY